LLRNLSGTEHIGKRVLFSFDIDGTLEIGDPAGPITLTQVRELINRDYIVGSGSDRVLAEQRAMWEKHDIPVHFVAHKHLLNETRSNFQHLDRYIHIGDTEVDKRSAEMHGFEFFYPEEFCSIKPS
tara:strand:+ start:168 stop:545 length:378 start_codon:yes stop_codon:yes gene_type:complete